MPAHLVFVSLLLGLVSGKQPVDLQADATVKSIRIVLDGREIARMTQPPWHTQIDLGPELLPRRLEAIGDDENGNEIGRASQILNLPRPNAEVEIALEYSQGFPKAAQLRWRNLEYAKPRKATMTFDDAALTLDSSYRVQFPRADWTRPHVINAQMTFDDDVVARREIVLGGATFSDTARAELTPILLTETSRQTAAYDGCFTLDASPVRAAAVEKEGAVVIFVRDPDAREAIRALDPLLRAINRQTRVEVSSWVRLDKDTHQEVLWPIPRQFNSDSREEVSLLFPHSREIEANDGLMLLMTVEGPFDRAPRPRRYADAVAVAGLNAIANGRRRAVVLVLGKTYSDASHDLDARTVRRYLQSIGVPLFVWSVAGPRPDLADSWGEVEDVSSVGLLRAAAAKLRKVIADQRIAWVHAGALDALHVKADERCGVRTMAQ